MRIPRAKVGGCYVSVLFRKFSRKMGRRCVVQVIPSCARRATMVNHGPLILEIPPPVEVLHRLRFAKTAYVRVSASCFMSCVDPRVNGSSCLPHSRHDVSVRYPSLRPTPLSLYPMRLRIPPSKRGRPHQATTNSPESPQP